MSLRVHEHKPSSFYFDLYSKHLPTPKNQKPTNTFTDFMIKYPFDYDETDWKKTLLEYIKRIKIYLHSNIYANQTIILHVKELIKYEYWGTQRRDLSSKQIIFALQFLDQFANEVIQFSVNNKKSEKQVFSLLSFLFKKQDNKHKTEEAGLKHVIQFDSNPIGVHSREIIIPSEFASFLMSKYPFS